MSVGSIIRNINESISEETENISQAINKVDSMGKMPVVVTKDGIEITSDSLADIYESLRKDIPIDEFVESFDPSIVRVAEREDDGVVSIEEYLESVVDNLSLMQMRQYGLTFKLCPKFIDIMLDYPSNKSLKSANYLDFIYPDRALANTLMKKYNEGNPFVTVIEVGKTLAPYIDLEVIVK